MSEDFKEVIGGRVELTRIQKLIGNRMLKSKRELPCFYLNIKADITELSKYRRKASKELKARLTTNDFFVAAMGRSVEQYPLMAGQIDGDSIVIADKANVGLAVAAPKGLVVPVVKGANEMSIVEISEALNELTDRARAGKLTPDEMNGACITLSSLGMYGIDSFVAVLPPGNTSIIAIGKIVPELVRSSSGEIESRKFMILNLAVDHRVVNGDYAARFLRQVVDYLEKPQLLTEKA